MFLKELTIKDFGPYKGINKVVFKDKQSVIFIQGTYTENKQSSNNAGKSSFLWAIVYLLFGEVKPGLTELDCIHTNQDDMYVEGKLDFDGQEVTIKRGRTRKNAAILEITGLDLKGTNTQKSKELIACIGMTYQDFLSSYFFKQSDITQFTDALPGDRKKLLQRWFNLDKWLVYEKRVADKVLTLDKEYEALVVTKTNLEKSLVTKDFDQHILCAQHTIQKLETDITGFRSQLSAAETQLASLDSYKDLENSYAAHLEKALNLSGQVTALMAKSNNLKAEIAHKHGCKKELEHLKTKVFKCSDLYQKDIDVENTALSKLEVDHTQKRSDHAALYKVYDSVCKFGGVCPIDQQPCDKGSRIPDQKAYLEDQLKKIDEELGYINIDINTVKANIKEFQRLLLETKALEKQINTLTPHSDATPYETALEQLKTTVETLLTQYYEQSAIVKDCKDKLGTFDLNVRKTLEDQIAHIKNMIGVAEKTKTTQNMVVGALEAEKQQNVKIKAEIDAVTLKTNTLNKTRYQWKYARQLLGKEIPSLLIENSLGDIEEFGNIIIHKVSRGTLKFEFQTTRELASTKEEYCAVCGTAFGTLKKCPSCGFGLKRNKVKDEVNIKVSNDGIEQPFEAVSDGGGKLIISLGLRLGLAKLLNQNAKCEMLFLDEPFANLDPVNRDQVSSLIFNELSNLLGIKQIFCISHCSLTDFAFDKLTIIREEGASKIVYG